MTRSERYGGREKPQHGFRCGFLWSKQRFRSMRICYEARLCKKSSTRRSFLGSLHGAVRTVWGRYKPQCGSDCQLLRSKHQFRGVRICYKARLCQKEALRSAASISSSRGPRNSRGPLRRREFRVQGLPGTLEDLYDGRTMAERWKNSKKRRHNPSNPDRTGDPGMG